MSNTGHEHYRVRCYSCRTILDECECKTRHRLMRWYFCPMCAGRTNLLMVPADAPLTESDPPFAKGETW